MNNEHIVYSIYKHLTALVETFRAHIRGHDIDATEGIVSSSRWV